MASPTVSKVSYERSGAWEMWLREHRLMVAPDKPLLVPLTSSLYVPGTLADPEHVIVDVGTGFYVEKSTDDAQKFYTSKIEELGKNIKDLESIVNGKANNLRVVEEVLRQKVLAEQGAKSSAGSS